jgi:hypothetical protein
MFWLWFGVLKGLKCGSDTLVLKGILVGEQNKQFQVEINLFPYSYNRNRVKKVLILKFPLNYVRNWSWNMSLNFTKENKKLEPEPCQNGTVLQHGGNRPLKTHTKKEVGTGLKL